MDDFILKIYRVSGYTKDNSEYFSIFLQKCAEHKMHVDKDIFENNNEVELFKIIENVFRYVTSVNNVDIKAWGFHVGITRQSDTKLYMYYIESDLSEDITIRSLK